MAEVVNRIYAPKVEDASRRKIPIRIVAATRDGAVEKANRDSALALYRDPEPLPAATTSCWNAPERVRRAFSPAANPAVPPRTS